MQDLTIQKTADIILTLSPTLLSVRRLLCILLLALLPLHGFAAPGGELVAGLWADIAHEVEHLKGVSHHHDDDGSIHFDDSGESSQHIAEHSASCHQVAALSSFTGLQTNFVFSIVALPESGSYLPDPILKLPQRPPQTLG